MADSTDNKDTTVKNEDGKLTTPKGDGETSTNKSALDPTQMEEQREDAQGEFDAAAEEGRKTAERNLAAEAEENGDAKPGAENKTAKVTTSEAQTELRADDDPADVKAQKVDERLGDDKAAQKEGAALKVGQATAKTNLETEASDQPEGKEDGTSYDDAVAEGLKSAKKNHAAEVKANKEANAR